MALSNNQTIVGDIYVGETINLAFAWKDADGNAVTPTTETLKIRPEGGTTQDVTISGGVASYTPAVGGCNHHWRATATSGGKMIVEQNEFNVKASNV